MPGGVVRVAAMPTVRLQDALAGLWMWRLTSLSRVSHPRRVRCAMGKSEEAGSLRAALKVPRICTVRAHGCPV